MSYVYFEEELSYGMPVEKFMHLLASLAEKWNVPLETLTIDSGYEYSYGDSVKSHVNISASRLRTEAELEAVKQQAKINAEKVRMLKLEQLEKLQKELGIK